MSYFFTELSSSIVQFHFLRPWLLLVLAPGFGLAFFLARHSGQNNNWHGVIAPELLPYLIEQDSPAKQHRLHWWVLALWLCACLALAGPSWKKIPLPIHKYQTPLVILFDLSPSMLAEDIKPNRLTRARLKLIDLLKNRREGTTALVAYAGDAHVVTPLTDDTATIISLLPALNPTMMPLAGNQPEQALKKGLELIFKSGLQNGHILLVTDGIPSEDLPKINSLLSSLGGFNVSVLALGTTDGAPIPSTEGGFIKDNQGSIVIAQLQEKPLQNLARNNGGIYQKIRLDDDDINDFSALFNSANSEQTEQLQRTFDTWHDSGFWLILPILFLLIPAFRRNVFALLIVAPLLFGTNDLHAMEWQDLWLRSDQQAQKALSAGDGKTAETLFKNPSWKGSAAYQNGNFSAAQKHFRSSERNADSLYNLANAQAKAGLLKEALNNYKTALELQSDHQDAAFNKNLVEQALNQQQKKEKSKDKQDSKKNDDSTENDSSKDEPSSDSEQQKQDGDKDSKAQPDSSQNNEQKQNPQSPESSAESNKEPNDNNLAQAEQESTPESTKAKAPTSAERPSKDDRLTEEQRQALEQWLRRVPDDPSGLMRRKFKYEAWQRSQQGQVNKQEKERW